MPQFILALDQGTTSSRSILFDGAGMPVATAQREFTQHFPRSGWVEHDAEEIWATQAATIAEVLARARATPADVAAIGITNQRETTVLWDRRTGRPLAPAIVWQDRRTADLCQQLQADGLEPEVARRTGLLLDPYFSGTKLAWLLDHVPGARQRAENGELAFGTIDSWLVWKLSNGERHVTDVSNASRTLLLNVTSARWDDFMLERLRIPRAVLPQVVPSSLGPDAPVATLGAHAIPIAGIAGDQQAALVRPGLLRARHGQEHLRHGLLPADEHRHGAARLQQSTADDHRLADDGPALCAGRRRVRRWRGRAVVAGRARDHRALSRHRSAGSERPRCRRRLSGARLHRTRQPALGRVRARNDGRAVARNDACPHRTRRARGDRFPERRGAAWPCSATLTIRWSNCGWTAAPRRTTC